VKHGKIADIARHRRHRRHRSYANETTRRSAVDQERGSNLDSFGVSDVGDDGVSAIPAIPSRSL
jgi:hypothetical protein